MPMNVTTHFHPHSRMGLAAEWAKKQEALGYDGVWQGEAHWDPFPALALMAEHTSRIRFGPNVIVAFARSPYVTAELGWGLSDYSKGRTALGIGTQVKGHNERRFSVPWGPPRPRLKEYLEMIRNVWDSWQNGAQPNYEGKYYQYKLTSWNFNPGPIEYPNIPLAIAAVNTGNTRLASETADGVLFHGFMSWRWRDEMLMPEFEKGAKLSGRDPKDLIIAGGGFLITAKTQEQLQKKIEEQKTWISFYASTRTYRKSMEMEGFDEQASELHKMSIEGRWDLMPAVITDEMLHAYCCIGTWDEIVPKMREKFGGINTEVSFPSDVETPDDEAQLREIIRDLKQLPVYGEKS